MYASGASPSQPPPWQRHRRRRARRPGSRFLLFLTRGRVWFLTCSRDSACAALAATPGSGQASAGWPLWHDGRAAFLFFCRLPGFPPSNRRELDQVRASGCPCCCGSPAATRFLILDRAERNGLGATQTCKPSAPSSLRWKGSDLNLEPSAGNTPLRVSLRSGPPSSDMMKYRGPNSSILWPPSV